MNDFTRYQLPAILYAAVIFIASSIPSLSPPPIGFEWDDKIYHFFEYALFGYLCARAFYYQRNRVLQDFAMIIALVVGSLYAVSDELHQSLVPGRYADVGDFVADVLGVIVAVVFFSRQVAARKRPGSRNSSRKSRFQAEDEAADLRPVSEGNGKIR